MSQLTTLFTDIADAIRAKKGTSETIVASNFPTEITNLPSGGGSDYNFGVAIDIEAQNTINKGDKIIAQANSQATTPTMGASFTESGLLTVSGDKSVAIQATAGSYSSKTVGTGSTLVIWFRDEQTGQYGNGYSITLENYPIATLLYNSFVINNDGTLAYGSAYTSVSSATSFDNCLLVFEIDKENKTATYRYKQLNFSHLQYGGTSGATTEVMVDSVVLDGHGIYANSNGNGTYGVAWGDYVICKAIGHATRISDGVYISNFNMLVVLKYDKTLHDFSLEYYSKGGEQPSFISSNDVKGNCAKIDDENILFKMGQYLFKYNITNKTISYGSSTGVTFGCFSRNGRYVCSASGTSTTILKVWEVSFVDLSLTLKYDKTISLGSGTKHFGYVSDDGNWLWTDCVQLFDLSTDTHYYVEGLSGSSHAIPNGYLDAHDFIDVYTNSSPYAGRIIALTPGSNAEYVASSTQLTDCSSAGIYGIASQSLIVGQRGEARALFVTGGGT